MKLKLFFIIGILGAKTALSQVDLLSFNNERDRITRHGMLVLGSWATANIIAGAAGLISADGETKYFHQMNLIWGSVNLAIAATTYTGLRKKSPGSGLSQTVQAQSGIEKTFLLNGGLDLVYITAGLYCMEKSKNQADPAKYRGYGKSLFVQGGGLLLFDVILYFTHHAHGRELNKVLDQIQFSGNHAGFIWKF